MILRARKAPRVGGLVFGVLPRMRRVVKRGRMRLHTIYPAVHNRHGLGPVVQPRIRKVCWGRVPVGVVRAHTQHHNLIWPGFEYLDKKNGTNKHASTLPSMSAVRSEVSDTCRYAQVIQARAQIGVAGWCSRRGRGVRYV